MIDLIVRGILVHLFADWFLQNEWMAINKVNLRHPAAWVHAGIHTVLMLLVFHPLIAFFIGIAHLLIDTRVPLAWWRKVYGQTTEGIFAIHVAIWEDQVAHILIVALAAWLQVNR